MDCLKKNEKGRQEWKEDSIKKIACLDEGVKRKGQHKVRMAMKPESQLEVYLNIALQLIMKHFIKTVLYLACREISSLMALMT